MLTLASITWNPSILTCGSLTYSIKKQSDNLVDTSGVISINLGNLEVSTTDSSKIGNYLLYLEGTVAGVTNSVNFDFTIVDSTPAPTIAPTLAINTAPHY